MSAIGHNQAKRSLFRRTILRVLSASIASSAVCLPALAVDRAGTVVATLTVTFAAAPAAGSRVSCGVALIGDDTHSPADNRSVDVAVVGSKATCKLTIPYKWHLASATSKMSIAYSVSGPRQSSSGIHSVFTVPANGTNTTVAVAISQ